MLRLFVLIAACFVPLSPQALSRSRPPAAEWTWVLAASLETPEKAETGQADLALFARRMFEYYQRQSIYAGRLVPESELAAAPSGPTVFLGPLDGFRHPDWLTPLLATDGVTATVGARTFGEPLTGIYVRSEDGQRVALTGITGAGFRQIFGVQTGRAPATVTFEGRVALRGEYRNGALMLKGQGTVTALPNAAALYQELSPLAEALDAVDVSPVYGDRGATQLSSEFQDRLGALVAGQRVLFVGESHWNVGINRLFRQAFEWLMDEREVSTLFLEVPYSHSAHFHHYVGIVSDEAASLFWAQSLRPLVISAMTRDLLEAVRLRNRARPESTVSVACMDAEFDLARTLKDVLAAYFEFQDAGFECKLPEDVTVAAVLAEIERLRSLLGEQAPDARRHPWMSKEFVGRVLINLEESARAVGTQGRMGARQRSMVRNITEFHGDRFDSDRGLAVFKMGSAHADRSAVRRDGAFWEAPYLDRHFAATRGRVATMLIDAVGYRFESVGRVSRQTHQTWATQYHRFVEDYRWALRAGTVTEGSLCRLGEAPLSGVEKVLLHRFYSGGSGAVLVNAMAESKLLDAGLAASAAPWERFDEVVFVVGGQMEEPMRKSRAR